MLTYRSDDKYQYHKLKNINSQITTIQPAQNVFVIAILN